MLGMAQVLSHFGLQCALNQFLGQLLEKPVLSNEVFRLFVIGQQTVYKFVAYGHLSSFMMFGSFLPFDFLPIGRYSFVLFFWLGRCWLIPSVKYVAMNSRNTTSFIPASGYAGDVSPELAWRWVQSGEAVLLDVRSDAEREWVGFVPQAVPLAWKQWPGMAMNPSFDEAIQAAVPAGQKAVLLCRSGVRSIAAAKRATELGLEAYNILEGFEGDADDGGHRGLLAGWRQRGLPWRQN